MGTMASSLSGGGAGLFSGPPKYRHRKPHEGEHSKGERRIEIPDAVQVIELVEVPALQSRNQDVPDPAGHEDERSTGGNEPASEQKKVHLLFHSLVICLFGCVIPLSFRLSGSKIGTYGGGGSAVRKRFCSAFTRESKTFGQECGNG